MQNRTVLSRQYRLTIHRLETYLLERQLERGVVKCQYEGTGADQDTSVGHLLQGTASQTVHLAPHPDQQKNWLHFWGDWEEMGEVKWF